MEKEQALLVNFKDGLEDISQLRELEGKLMNRIHDKNLGEFDSHSINTDLTDGTIYMYGPSAEALYRGVNDILENEKFLNGAIAVLRYGGPDDECEEKEIVIKASC